MLINIIIFFIYLYVFLSINNECLHLIKLERHFKCILQPNKIFNKFITMFILKKQEIGIKV